MVARIKSGQSLLAQSQYWYFKNLNIQNESRKYKDLRVSSQAEC